MKKGSKAELADEYKQLLAQSPPTAEGLYDAGVIASKLGRPRDAEAAWARLRKEFPDHALAGRAALELAQGAFTRSAWKDASALAQSATNSSESAVRAEALVLLGESELRLKRYPTAYQAFQQAVEAPGQDPALRFRSLAGIGLLMEEQRQWAQAAKYYEEVAAKSPDTTLRNWAKERRAAVAAKLKPAGGPAEARAEVGGARSEEALGGGARGRRSLVRRRSIARILAVALLVFPIASARPARAEIAFKLPPPEVNGLLPLAALPLDKPPVALSPARRAGPPARIARAAARQARERPGPPPRRAPGAPARARMQSGRHRLRRGVGAGRVRSRSLSARRARARAPGLSDGGAGDERSRAAARGEVLARRDAPAARPPGGGRALPRPGVPGRSPR